MESYVAISKESMGNAFDEISLDSLVVRTIVPGEEDEWNRLMAAHHYLGFQKLTGPSVKYVATLGGQWVGLVGWGGGVLKTAGRDQWIGMAARMTYPERSGKLPPAVFTVGDNSPTQAPNRKPLFFP